MKKFTGLLLALFLLFALNGCGSSAGNADKTENKSSQVETFVREQQSETAMTQVEADAKSAVATTNSQGQRRAASESGKNVLVVYFSRTGEQYEVGVIDRGNTAIVADMIIDATGADRFEIIPQNAVYPTSYKELTNVAKQEQNENARPAIAGELPDIARYDTIFIGAPVWWSDWPMICYTYFEANDFSGKTLIPFATHAGSGLSGFDRKLQSVAPGAAVKTGMAVRGSDCQNDPNSVRQSVKNWLTGLGL